MKQLTIALAPSGAFRLQLPTHHIDIPVSENGAALLATTIREWTNAADPRIGTTEAPTQAQILLALRGTSWGEVKQLFGNHQRRADIKAATGVSIKSISAAKPRKRELSLADLGL